MTKARNNLLYLVFFYIILILLFFCNLIIKSHLLTFIGLIIYIYVILSQLKMRPVNFIVFSFILYSILFQPISGFILELGAFSTELNKQGYFNNSTLLFIVLNYMFLFPISLIDCSKCTRYKKILPYYFVTIVTIVTVLYVFLMLLNAYLYSAPLFQGINRQGYWKNYTGFRIIPIIYGRSSLLGLFLGICFWRKTNHKARLKIIFLLSICILIYILYGTKFSGILIFLYLFFISVILTYSDKSLLYDKIKYGAKKLVIPLFSFFFLLICFSYSFVLKTQNKESNISLILGMVKNRIAQQGQLLWEAANVIGTDKALHVQGGILADVHDGLRRLDYPDPNTNSGMMVLVKELASKNVARYYPKDGIALTAGADALALIQHGYLGLFCFKFLSVFLIGLFFYFFIKSLYEISILKLIILNELYWYVIIGVFFDARFQRLYDPKNMILLGFYLLLWLVDYGKRIQLPSPGMKIYE